MSIENAQLIINKYSHMHSHLSLLSRGNGIPERGLRSCVRTVGGGEKACEQRIVKLGICRAGHRPSLHPQAGLEISRPRSVCCATSWPARAQPCAIMRLPVDGGSARDQRAAA